MAIHGYVRVNGTAIYIPIHDDTDTFDDSFLESGGRNFNYDSLPYLNYVTSSRITLSSYGLYFKDYPIELGAQVAVSDLINGLSLETPEDASDDAKTISGSMVNLTRSEYTNELGKTYKIIGTTVAPYITHQSPLDGYMSYNWGFLDSEDIPFYLALLVNSNESDPNLYQTLSIAVLVYNGYYNRWVSSADLMFATYNEIVRLPLEGLSLFYKVYDSPPKIENIYIEPAIPYIDIGESIQFSLFAKIADSEDEDVSQFAIWGLVENTTEEPVSELNGFTITSDGLLTANNPTSDEIIVSARYIGAGTAFTTVSLPGKGEVYSPGGNSGASVGSGSYDNTFGPNISTGLPGQTITLPPAIEGDPDIIIQTGAAGNDVSDSGMYTKYLCNQNYLNLLAQFFWEDNVGIQALKAIFGNPIDSVISLMAYPFDLTTLVATRQQNFFFGKYDSLIPGIAVTKSSLQIDWGTIEIPFYWGNFLDYAPYTQVQLYLPWGVGFVTIDPNEIMPYPNKAGDFNIVNYNPGSIRVVTNIELDKGGCVHNVIGNRGLVIGSFGGACGKQIPMTALDQSAKTLALMGAASGVGMAAGNAMANALSGKYTEVTPKYHIGLNGQVNRISFEHSFNAKEMGREMGNSRSIKAGLASAAALAHTPPNYPRAGTFSDATSALSIQTPYIIISRPSQSVPASYGAYNGYPSNIYYDSLSRLSGYTEISEIHLDGVPATLEEITELESLLKGGVLL